MLLTIANNKNLKNFIDILKKVKFYTKTIKVDSGSALIVLKEDFYFYKKLDFTLEDDLYISNICEFNKIIKNINIENLILNMKNNSLCIKSNTETNFEFIMPIGDYNMYPLNICLNEELDNIEEFNLLSQFNIELKEFKKILKSNKNEKDCVVNIIGCKDDKIINITKLDKSIEIKTDIINKDFNFDFKLKKSYFNFYSDNLVFKLILSDVDNSFAYLKMEQTDCVHLFSSVKIESELLPLKKW